MGSKTVHSFSNPTNKTHPTEKPIKLMEFYITNSSNEGDVVLDPFMGSGSTGIACKNNNRNFIGIELDTNYFDLATKRINDV
jgi:site-specific DNA-methyltransferase (adenine-specific)